MNNPLNSPAVNKHGKLTFKLLAIVAASFAFGFALVPLYDVLCQVTGLNGKTNALSASSGKSFGPGGIQQTQKDERPAPSRIDRSRVVTVEFVGTVMPGLAWDMQPLTSSLDLHPGELHQALYRVHNRSDKAIVGQAIPSVTPGLAAQYFEKLDCFCFAQQTLAAGETRDMPLTFIVQPGIDKGIHTITLAYAFFNVADPKSAESVAER